MKARIIYDPYEAIGGSLCIDFVNTLGGNRKSTSFDYLHSYSDLVDWAYSVGSIDAHMKKKLLSKAKNDNDASTRSFHKAIQLRETLYRMISALMTDQIIAESDLLVFNTELSSSNAQRNINFSSHIGTWEFSSNDNLDRVLWPVMISAAEIFTNDNLSLIKECGNETCGWLFLDQTKNKNRRWCDMSICGNRVKQRNFQKKLKDNLS